LPLPRPGFSQPGSPLQDSVLSTRIRDADQDRPQRCAPHCAIDAAWLVRSD